MTEQILQAANRYAEGVNAVEQRRHAWMQKAIDVEKHLKEIADYLNANAAYKANYYTEVQHAYDEHTDGSCIAMAAVMFGTRKMPMMLVFEDKDKKKKEVFESGFVLSFSPSVTGQIVVQLLPHHNELQPEPPVPVVLEIIDEVDKLTNEDLDGLIIAALTNALHTSFTGVAEAEKYNKETRTPIGFRMHEGTTTVAQATDIRG